MRKFMKVLHYIPAFNYGGIESLVMNILDFIDPEAYNFDFLVEVAPPVDFLTKVEALGGKIIRIAKPTDKGRVLAHLLGLVKALHTGRYDAVHIHAFDTRPFLAGTAKILGVKKVILHAHSTSHNNEKYLWVKRLITKISVKMANRFCGCSPEAARFMFGSTVGSQALIINNGISLHECRYSDLERRQVQAKLGIKENELLILHVGRFTFLKNHSFIISIIANLKRNNFPFKCVLLGNGELEDEIKNLAKDKAVEDSIIFAGFSGEVSLFLATADILILPSIREGIPLVLIEAQALGTPVLASNTVNTRAKVVSNFKFLPLKDAGQWAEELMSISKRSTAPLDFQMGDAIRAAGYDIESTVAQLVDLYNH